jgi:hypothetical protein
MFKTRFMVWHAYKYLAKTVHRIFFPILAMLDSAAPKAGDRVVAQRKLLYIEKLFAAILLGAPRFKSQLAERVKSLQIEVDKLMLNELDTDDQLCVRRQTLLQILKGLQSLTTFYLPAVFRIGWLSRNCTWEGRDENSSKKVRLILEETLVLLVHLLQDTDCHNEYVRTLAVALSTWQDWNSRLPAVSYMEESCEALLSRMSHRCSAHRHLHGFEATFDLFITLPPPSRAKKATRGSLRSGLIDVFASRIRNILCSDGILPFAPIVGSRQMHSEFIECFPANITFKDKMPSEGAQDVYERVLRKALLCLTSKTKVGDKVTEFMQKNVIHRQHEDLLLYDRKVAELKTSIATKRKAKPPPKRKVFCPKPRAEQDPHKTDLFSIFRRDRV